MQDGDDLGEENLSFHEAAHAVAGVVCGLSLKYVTILAFNGTIGRTEFVNDKHFDALRDLPGWPECTDAHFIMLLAGAAAVAQFGKEHTYDGGAADRAEVQRLLRDVYVVDQRESQFQRLCELAKTFVHEHSAPIGKVARDLRQEKILVSSDVTHACKIYGCLPPAQAPGKTT